MMPFFCLCKPQVKMVDRDEPKAVMADEQVSVSALNKSPV